MEQVARNQFESITDLQLSTIYVVDGINMSLVEQSFKAQHEAKNSERLHWSYQNWVITYWISSMRG